MIRILTPIGRLSPEVVRRVRADGRNELFDAFPGLIDRVPWRSLGGFPTPVEELPAPARHARLFVKRDDGSAAAYGGNKVRKLEHLLAAAEGLGRRSLVTMGGLGSNHGLATAILGTAAGFEVELALYDQPVTPLVTRNLQAFLAAGARLHYGRNLPGAFLAARRAFSRLRREGRDPFFIMVGGTSRLGCLGHVTAGLELGRQVRAGVLPEPDRLFVPLGTCGTAAGLIVGLKLAGLRTQVVAVRVADPIAANGFLLHRLASDLATTLHELDPAIPLLKIRRADFTVLTDYLGPGYGYGTEAADSARAWAAERLSLETTYSAKALAAALDHCRSATAPTNVLFWNTYSSAPVTTAGDWHGLPPGLAHLATADPSTPTER